MKLSINNISFNSWFKGVGKHSIQSRYCDFI